MRYNLALLKFVYIVRTHDFNWFRHIYLLLFIYLLYIISDRFIIAENEKTKKENFSLFQCIWNFRTYIDSERAVPVPRLSKILIGGGIVIAILAILIFPIVWYSMFESKPDTPSSMDFTITIGEDITIFSTKSDDVHKWEQKQNKNHSRSRG